MTVYGWDNSDFDYGRGPVDLHAARKAGVALITAKVSEGTGFRALHAAETFRRATHRFAPTPSRRRCSKYPVLGGYHVLHPADMSSIAAQVDWYLQCLTAAYPGWRDHPCFLHQIDAEKFSYMTRRPNLAEIHEFGDRVQDRAGCAPTQILAYAPQWLYGDHLAGLRWLLWASDYGTNPISGFKDAYPGDRSSRWGPYSGITPTLLQFGSQTTIGSQRICDANAIRVATEADLVALFQGKGDEDMPSIAEIFGHKIKAKDGEEHTFATWSVLAKKRADAAADKAAAVQQELDATRKELDAVKAQVAANGVTLSRLAAGQLHIDPADVHVTGTVHLGGTQ